MDKVDISRIVVDGPKSGEEIAQIFGVTRQNISNTLKRAMRKVFIETSKLDPEWSPFQVSAVMVQMFNLTDIDDIRKFYNLFPPDLKKVIEEDAKSYISKDKL